MTERRDEEREFWRPKEFAKAKHIGLNQVYDGIHSKEIPAIRIGCSYLIPKVAWEKRLADAGEAA